MTDTTPAAKFTAILTQNALVGSYLAPDGSRQWVAWVPGLGGDFFPTNGEAFEFAEREMIKLRSAG